MSKFLACKTANPNDVGLEPFTCGGYPSVQLKQLESRVDSLVWKHTYCGGKKVDKPKPGASSSADISEVTSNCNGNGSEVHKNIRRLHLHDFDNSNIFFLLENHTFLTMTK